MFTLTINPILVSIGPIAIRYYGLVYSIGFLFTYFYLRFQIKKKKLHISLDQLDTLIIAVILGVVVGGRLGEYIFWQPKVLLSNPLQILKIWQGGMSFHGGIIGVALATWWFCKKYKVKFYELTDQFVIPASLTLAFGRAANFINQELVGRVTNVPWCVHFVNAPNPADRIGCRHPSQLYETVKNLAIFFILLAHEQGQQLRKKYRDGYLTWLFVLLYGVFRTIANIWRDEITWFFGIFGTGQLMSLAMAIIALVILLKFYWLRKEKAKHKQHITHHKPEHKRKTKTKGKNRRRKA